MSKAKPVHAPMTQFAVVDDCLQIGGVPLTALADRVGRTPFYAYDRNLMTQRVELLRRRLPADVQLHYAIKANPMPGVVQHLARLVDGLDVASAGELQVALASGMDPAEVSFAGPGKTDAELAAGGRCGDRRQPRIGTRDGAPGGSGKRRRGPAPGGGAGQSRLRVEELRHENGRRAEAVRRGRRTRAGNARAHRRPRTSTSRAFTSSAARRTCARRPSWRRRRRR